MADTKWSQFPSATPGNSDEVVGLHSGDNARFTIANIIAAVRNGLANIFVPLTRTINGKALNNDISLDASDVGAVDTADVGVADGVASLDSTGKVPSSQLPPTSSDASDITYDPTTSGLTATDVQAAIDEVVDDLGGKQSTITASGILKGDGAGGVSAATAGTDYQAPLTAGTDYATPAQLADKANQSQIAYVETGTTASQAYAVGEYFCWNGLLYRAKTAISSGGTFTPGTNCTQVTEGGFNSLKAQTLVRRQTLATSITTGLNEWDIAVAAVSGYQAIGIVGVQFAALPRSAVTLSQFLLDNGTNVVVAAQSTQARTSGIAVNAFVLYAKE